MNIVKDFLKEQYPDFNGFIEHTMVAEMAQKYAEYYHTLQLRKTDVMASLLSDGFNIHFCESGLIDKNTGILTVNPEVYKTLKEKYRNEP